MMTSWGHVLIADVWGHGTKVFSEVGDYLDRLQDSNGQIKRSRSIHIDEAEGLMYVGREGMDALELRKYRFTAGDLSLLPITSSVTKMATSLKLTDI